MQAKRLGIRCGQHLSTALLFIPFEAGSHGPRFRVGLVVNAKGSKCSSEKDGGRLLDLRSMCLSLKRMDGKEKTSTSSLENGHQIDVREKKFPNLPRECWWFLLRKHPYRPHSHCANQTQRYSKRNIYTV